MAVSYTCDACGKEVKEKEVKEFGMYAKVHYCPEHTEIYEKFEEVVKERIVINSQKFEEWLAEQKKYLKDKKGFRRLPDERE